ncbi:unnamed protein product [Ambrosiozyma monospora]|uniref:Unnamed protein product n=1 Tax=Ambrosiozyma monospora TaxID=43982 RepID=A0ACB5U0X8_AMBMO|nr:unnamed protein product [Ambrosiozyma monospora]
MLAGFELIQDDSKLSRFNHLIVDPLIPSSSLPSCKPMHYSTSFIGVDTHLDNVILSIIQEPVFEPSAFQNNQLKKFVDFVLARSIKIHLKTTSAFKLDQEPHVSLLSNGCGEFTANFTKSELPQNANYLNFVTVLNCELHLLGEFLRTTIFMPLSHSRCLKLLVDYSTTFYLEGPLVQKLVQWRDASGDGSPTCGFVVRFGVYHLQCLEICYVCLQVEKN